LIVDTSYENRYEEFTRKLESKGIALSEIKYLFLTHHHDDHSGFAEELRAANGQLTLITHEKSLVALKSGKPDPDDRPLNRRVGFFIFLFNNLLKEKQDWSFPPVQVLQSDCVVRADNFDFLPSIGIDGKILHTPGHSHDSMSIILADGSAFVGDLAMDLLNFCGCRKRPIYITDLNEVYQSWNKIIEYGARMIYSSHASKPFGVDEIVKTMKRFGVY
jgi:glyoxylase-like metal-dependent hydrolase (beta-lactamase superfamily II)